MIYKRVGPPVEDPVSSGIYTEPFRYDSMDTHAYELEYGVWSYKSFHFEVSAVDRVMTWLKEYGVTEYSLAFDPDPSTTVPIRPDQYNIGVPCIGESGELDSLTFTDYLHLGEAGTYRIYFLRPLGIPPGTGIVEETNSIVTQTIVNSPQPTRSENISILNPSGAVINTVPVYQLPYIYNGKLTSCTIKTEYAATYAAETGASENIVTITYPETWAPVPTYNYQYSYIPYAGLSSTETRNIEAAATGAYHHSWTGPVPTLQAYRLDYNLTADILGPTGPMFAVLKHNKLFIRKETYASGVYLSLSIFDKLGDDWIFSECVDAPTDSFANETYLYTEILDPVRSAADEVALQYQLRVRTVPTIINGLKSFRPYQEDSVIRIDDMSDSDGYSLYTHNLNKDITSSSLATASRVDNVATITTENINGFFVGMPVRVTLIDGYDQSFNTDSAFITNIISNTSFQYDNAGDPTDPVTITAVGDARLAFTVTGAELTWTPVPKASEYQLYINSELCSIIYPSIRDGVATCAYTHTESITEDLVDIQVIMRTKIMDFVGSAVYVDIPAQEPTATDLSPGHQISWTPIYKGYLDDSGLKIPANHYDIYAAHDTAPALIYIGATGATTYDDIDATRDTATGLYYRVFAYSSTGDKLNFLEVTATPNGTTSHDLAWTGPELTDCEYRVYCVQTDRTSTPRKIYLTGLNDTVFSPEGNPVYLATFIRDTSSNYEIISNVVINLDDTDYVSRQYKDSTIAYTGPTGPVGPTTIVYNIDCRETDYTGEVLDAATDEGWKAYITGNPAISYTDTTERDGDPLVGFAERGLQLVEYRMTAEETGFFNTTGQPWGATGPLLVEWVQLPGSTNNILFNHVTYTTSLPISTISRASDIATISLRSPGTTAGIAIGDSIIIASIAAPYASFNAAALVLDFTTNTITYENSGIDVASRTITAGTVAFGASTGVLKKTIATDDPYEYTDTYDYSQPASITYSANIINIPNTLPTITPIVTTAHTVSGIPESGSWYNTGVIKESVNYRIKKGDGEYSPWLFGALIDNTTTMYVDNTNYTNDYSLRYFTKNVRNHTEADPI